MFIRFFANKQIFYYNPVGRRKSEDQCIGHFSLKARFNVDNQSTGEKSKTKDSWNELFGAWESTESSKEI